MAAGQSAGTSLVFSITIGSETSYGLIQSLSVNATVERAEAKGPDGHTYAIQEYENKYEMSMTYLEKASPSSTPNPEPLIGTAFVLDVGSLANVAAPTTWYINSWNATETVDGFRSVDMTATAYPNLDATP